MKRLLFQTIGLIQKNLKADTCLRLLLNQMDYLNYNNYLVVVLQLMQEKYCKISNLEEHYLRQDMLLILDLWYLSIGIIPMEDMISGPGGNYFFGQGSKGKVGSLDLKFLLKKRISRFAEYNHRW